MAIKVTTTESKQEQPFPKLMIAGDTIWLMTSKDLGICLKTEGTTFFIGMVHNDFGPFLKDYDNPITLQNEPQ